MPHRIDIDGISRNLFLLRNLAFASQSFCQTYRVDRCQDDDARFGWAYYLGWLKTSVSEMLLETAIKTRVIEDFLRHEDVGSVDFAALAEKASGTLVAGRYLPSLKPIPIRECCNKIIHALEVRLTWIETTDANGSYEYWNGDVHLHGIKGKDHWECELYVIEFTETIDNLLFMLAEEVDWYHVYKYDE